MATHSRLSMLGQCLLVSSLVLCVSFFSCCDATSRSLENMDRYPRQATFTSNSAAAAEHMERSCDGSSRASCRTTNLEPDMRQSEEIHMSSRNSNPASAATEMSGSRSSEDLERIGDSDSERMRGTEGIRDEMRENEKMTDSRTNRMRNSERVSRASDGMRDSNRMRESATMRESDARDSERVRESDTMRKSERMWDSDKVRDSERAVRNIERNQKTRSIETERSGRTSGRLRNSEWTGAGNGKRRVVHNKSESMSDSERIRDAEERKDFHMHGGRDLESTGEQRTDFHMHGRGDLERTGDSESKKISRDSRSDTILRESESRMNVVESDRMGNSDSVIRDVKSELPATTMNPSFCHGTSCHSTRDVQRMESRTRDSDVMHSRSTTDIDAAVTGTELRGSERMDTSTRVQAGSRKLNGADCRINAPDGNIRGSSSHEMDSRNMDTSTKAKERLPASSCRLNGPDCHIAPDRETKRSPSMDSAERVQSANAGRMSSCSDDHEHCRKATAQTTVPSERMHRGRNDQELFPGASEVTAAPKWMNSERSTVEVSDTDAETMTSERTSTMTELDRMRSAAHPESMRSTDSERMNTGSRKVSSEWRAGSEASDTNTEGRSSRVRSSEMAHVPSAAERSNVKMTGPRMTTIAQDSQPTRNAEIDGSGMRNSEMMDTVSRAVRSTMEPSSCTNGANCRTANREIMHMSSSLRHSDTMERRHDPGMMHTGSTKMNVDRKGLTTDPKRVDSEPEESRMMRRKSDQMRSSEFMGSD